MRAHLHCFFQQMLILFLLVGCTTFGAQSSQPVASPAAAAFLLGIDAFPKGWVSSIYEQSEFVGGQDFYKPKIAGHAFQDIYRHPNDGSASDKYRIYLESEFKVSTVRQPFVPFAPPPEVRFQSKVADEYYFACGIEMIASCKMIARYRNYFVFFYFELATKEQSGLTYAEIEHVLEAFETKVNALFSIQSNKIVPE